MREYKDSLCKNNKREIGLIVARSENNVIGKNGRIPWDIEGELSQFKELTMGNAVVMGRRTYEEIGHPLPGRKTIVVSRGEKYEGDNICTVRSVEEASGFGRMIPTTLSAVPAGSAKSSFLPSSVALASV